MSSAPLTLVTGATGLVGNNLVRLLRDRGEAVRVLARASSDSRALAGLDVEIVSGDVRDDQAVAHACRGADCVIHCAGHVRIGWAQPELYQAINVDGTRNVAQACQRLGMRLVHVSSTDVFGRCSLTEATNEDTPEGDGPRVPYVSTKRAAEGIVREQAALGLQAVTVNPSFMLGPWDWKPSSGRMLLAVGRGSAILAPRGWFSLCDVRDVAAGIVAARDRGMPGRRYILAGRTLELIEAFRLMAEVTGARKPLCRVGPVLNKIGGFAGDWLAKVVGHEPDINSAAVRLGALPKNYSSARAEKDLGYAIRPTHDTIRDAWDWFDRHGYR
jgi:dihydroflavonol-4-reductase